MQTGFKGGVHTGVFLVQKACVGITCQTFHKQHAVFLREGNSAARFTNVNKNCGRQYKNRSVFCPVFKQVFCQIKNDNEAASQNRKSIERLALARCGRGLYVNGHQRSQLVTGS